MLYEVITRSAPGPARGGGEDRLDRGKGAGRHRRPDRGGGAPDRVGKAAALQLVPDVNRGNAKGQVGMLKAGKFFRSPVSKGTTEVTSPTESACSHIVRPVRFGSCVRAG